MMTTHIEHFATTICRRAYYRAGLVAGLGTGLGTLYPAPHVLKTPEAHTTNEILPEFQLTPGTNWLRRR